jgi:outer membrane receptor for ferrienterochelin and colicins
MTHILTTFFLCLCVLHSATAQQPVYRVLDATNQQPLPGATVRITCMKGACQDSSIAIMTNRRGEFPNPFGTPSRVVIKFIGYRTITDTLTGTESHTFLLEEDAVMMEQIVVTGQYAPGDARESLYKVKVLDAQRIDDQAAVTLRDLLSNELNVRLSQDQVLGSSMSLQGVSGQNVKILVDGVPVIGRLNGNIDISQIMVNTAERVEIIEGPLSTLYGSDALGGVINILTKKPRANSFDANVDALYESVGTYNANASLSTTLGDTRVRVSGARNLFDGYTQETGTRTMLWKPRETYTTDWQVVQPIDSWQLRYSGRYFYDYILNRGEARLPYRETAFDDTYRTRRFDNALFAQGSIAEHTNVDITASFSTYMRRKNTFFKNLVTMEQQAVTSPSEHDTSYFDTWLVRGILATSQPDASWNYQAGFDLSLDRNTGQRVEGMEKQIGDYAVFGSLQFSPIKEITIQPSLRATYNTRYTAPLIPSLNVRIAPADGAVVRLSYARGFRAPALRELYFLFVDVNHNIRGNQELRAETSHHVSGSLTYTTHGSSYALTLEPSVFANFIDNLITLAQVDGSLYSYINLGVYRTVGTSVSATYTHSNMSARVGASYTGLYNQLSEDYSVSRFVYTPELQAQLQYTLPWYETRLAAFYKYTGRTPGYSVTEDGGLRQGYIDDYHMLDVSASIPLLDRTVTLGIGGKNLLNVRNIISTLSGDGSAHSSGNATLPVSFGRTFFCTLQWTLSL